MEQDDDLALVGTVLRLTDTVIRVFLFRRIVGRMLLTRYAGATVGEVECRPLFSAVYSNFAYCVCPAFVKERKRI